MIFDIVFMCTKEIGIPYTSLHMDFMYIILYVTNEKRIYLKLNNFPYYLKHIHYTTNFWFVYLCAKIK